MKIESIRKQVQSRDCRFTIHAFERCIERNISPEEIKYAIMHSEIIEHYPEDKYGPSCLMYGMTMEQDITYSLFY